MTEPKNNVQKGELFRIEGTEYVVFFVGDIVGVIGKDTLVFQNFDTMDFLERVSTGEFEFIPQEADASAPDLPDSELEKIRTLSGIMDGLLEDQYPTWARFADKGVPHRNVRDAATCAGYTVKPFRRLFYRYLRSGCNSNSLIDQRRLAMAHKQKKTGITDVQVLTAKEVAMLDGLKAFKELGTVKSAYKYILQKHYSSWQLVPTPNGMERQLVVNEDAPSYKVLWWFISEHLGNKTVTEYKKGEREVRNNDRLLTGSQRSGLISIGQMMHLDECEISVDLVDGSGRVIGKPIVYCAFDPYAQIITGVYIGLVNNAYNGVVNLFLSMLEPHNEQTKLVGVTCTDDQFPSMVLPRQVYCDQGSEYMSKMMERAMLDLGITVSPVPAATGSYKGGVENVFHRLQSRLNNLVPNDGFIKNTHDGPDKARKEAVLTIEDFKAICYNLVIELNTTSLGKLFVPDAEMIDNHIPPVPSEIWKFKKTRSFDPIVVTDLNRLQKMYALLWRDKTFTHGRDGLTYKGHDLRYFVDQEWFTKMIREKNPKYEVRYNDSDVSKIYVRYEDNIHIVELAQARDELRSYRGLSWSEYDEKYKEWKALRADQRKKDLNIMVNTSVFIVSSP